MEKRKIKKLTTQNTMFMGGQGSLISTLLRSEKGKSPYKDSPGRKNKMPPKRSNTMAMTVDVV